MVKVAEVFVDVTPELVEEPAVTTGSTGDDGDTKYMSDCVGEWPFCEGGSRARCGLWTLLGASPLE